MPELNARTLFSTARTPFSNAKTLAVFKC
jgi:hypothetical protein